MSHQKLTDTTAAERLRLHVEQEYAAELSALAASDQGPRPTGWLLTPHSVRTYLLGGETQSGITIIPKYIGDPRLIEIAIATLATDRALLLYGVPGTAKSWVSEHLAAAISGSSTLLIQGTAGTDESALRYGWNYASLIANGPSRAAMVPSPMMVGMQQGKIVRVEELTRISSETQDSLITILSEKTLPVPELNTEIQAARGFNVIATANNRDRGVNELSSALMRRFNTVVLPTPESLEDEVRIVRQRSEQLGQALQLPVEPPGIEEIRRVVTIFRELRSGVTEDGKTKVKIPSGTMSTAEAISVINSGMAMSAFFGDGKVHAEDWISSLVGAVVKDPVQDHILWNEYLQTVVRQRESWADIYRAGREANKSRD
jgi:MoxR-like ATPase